jgi:hypothetical protein
LQSEEPVVHFHAEPECSSISHSDRPLSVSRPRFEDDFNFNLTSLTLDKAQNLMLRDGEVFFIVLRGYGHEIDQKNRARLGSKSALEDIGFTHIPPLHLKRSGRGNAPMTCLRVQ